MLKIKLNTGHNYVIGEEILVVFEIVNTGPGDAFFHMPITSSGKLTSDILSIEINNHELTYHGMLIKAKDYRIPLKTGETVSFSIDLTKEYLINKEGSYSLNFNDDYFDTQYNMPNTTILNITDTGLQPIVTWYQISSTSKKLHPSAFKAFDSHKVFFATDMQFANLKQAHSKANEMLDIRLYMKQGMKYHFNADDCSPSYYAYVFAADPDKNIYLCDQYNKASSFPTKQDPYDTKAGTIIHEVSHKAVNSKDHFYSYEACKITAASCIDVNTTTNADCLQIFTELCFLSGESENGSEL